MRAFLQNKLWRDLAVDRLEAQGSIIRWRCLEKEEADRCLREKLFEEAEEVLTASTREDLLKEMIDLLEVLEALKNLHGFSKEDVELAKMTKHQALGGYDGLKYVTVAIHPEGSFGENYCLSDPLKYPEGPLEE